MKLRLIAEHCVYLLTAIMLIVVASSTAIHMNFMLGGFLTGTMLACILGSWVILFKGKDGRHGANYIQTFVNSGGSIAGVTGALLQSMYWLNIAPPSSVRLAAWLMCVGIFATLLGNAYTPILLGRLRLPYPSGRAAADIMLSLSDLQRMKRSFAYMIMSIVFGFSITLGWISSANAVLKIDIVINSIINSIYSLLIRLGIIRPVATSLEIGSLAFSGAAVGSGMIVGPRLAIPPLVAGLIGYWLTPWLCNIGALSRISDGSFQEFRHFGFFIGMAMILGASVVHIGSNFFRQAKSRSSDSETFLDWRSFIWAMTWTVPVIITTYWCFDIQPIFTIVAIALTIVMVLVSGIASGVSDGSPLSSVFVLSIFLISPLVMVSMQHAAIGTITLLVCGVIIMNSCQVGGDIQYDKAAGHILGSNPRIQLWYNLGGIVVGSVLSVLLVNAFLNSYPVLKAGMDESNAAGWGSAMTMKMVKAIQTVGNLNTQTLIGLGIGAVLGVLIQTVREYFMFPDPNNPERKIWSRNNIVDILLDTVIFPLPYTFAAGTFISVLTSMWIAFGGILSSVLNRRSSKDKSEAIPISSILGGGLIAGEALSYMLISVIQILKSLW